MHARLNRRPQCSATRHPLALALSPTLAATARVAGAATIQVTTADDAGTISTCTLRQAIAAMNSAAVGAATSCVNSSGSFGTGDTITFAADVATVTLADTANNELLITDSNLTIQGSGTGGVTISRISGATNAFRIFHDTGTFGEEYLLLNGLTITNGATIAANANGGAIFMEPQSYTTARLTLTDCIVNGNMTSGAGAVGGAIAGHVEGAMAPPHSGTAVTVNSSTVSGNSTSGSNAGGGAIYAQGVTLKDSIVTGNSTVSNASPGGAIQSPDVSMRYTTISHNTTAGNNSPGGGVAAKSTNYVVGGFGGNYNVISYNSTAGTQSPGGGVFAASTSGTFTLDIISNNSTSGGNSNGGGIYIPSYYGLNFASSTISGNKVTGPSSSGGGIWARFGKGAIKELFNSTISGNSASIGGGGISLNVCSSEASSALNIYNSTIAFNTSGAGGGGVYSGNVGCPAGESGKPTSATIAVTSTILSNNSSAGASSSDIGAQSGFALTVVTSSSLIRNPDAPGVSFTGPDSTTAAIITLDPLLQALVNNGCGQVSGAPGATNCVPTQAIGCHSPAYNAGSYSGTDEYDERGTGFPRRSNSGVDIGAYEDDDEIFCNGFEVRGAVQ
ncbi:MAG: choice-of-anchor Q domain-containing protein [Rudaea sp.]|nr:choice-of-anchor Q domain-containing protein [Rudaea sp.]